MMTENVRLLLAGYIDGELSESEKSTLERELAADPELRAELEEFRQLKEVTGKMTYADLPTHVWDTYWSSLYRKAERGFGWILLSLGAVVLLSSGLYEAFGELFTNPNNPLWLKLGVSGSVLGAVFLLVSYGRERLFAYNRDRYREVEK